MAYPYEDRLSLTHQSNLSVLGGTRLQDEFLISGDVIYNERGIKDDTGDWQLIQLIGWIQSATMQPKVTDQSPVLLGDSLAPYQRWEGDWKLKMTRVLLPITANLPGWSAADRTDHKLHQGSFVSALHWSTGHPSQP